MARVNIYLPDDLAEEAKAAALNVSRVAQEALRRQLDRTRTADWVERVRQLAPTKVTHRQVVDAVHAARDEMGAPNA